MKKAYLAYGSNMSTEQMSYRCPRAKIIGTGILQNWRLMFKGTEPLVTTYATIEEWQGYQVPFVLWDITRKHEMRLDLYEGVTKNCYYKKYIEVELNGEKYNALIYVKDEELPVNIASVHYVDVLWKAYEKFNFDLNILKGAVDFSQNRYQMSW